MSSWNVLNQYQSKEIYSLVLLDLKINTANFRLILHDHITNSLLTKWAVKDSADTTRLSVP